MLEHSPPLVVRTRGLSKSYGDRIAVDRVSLTVRRGEVYGFLGPNGAGKTTTLRMVLGLVRPSGGSVTVLGGAPDDRDVVARVGALVEGPGFFPYLSGRDNLRVMARYRGLEDAAVDAALDRVDLTARGRDRFARYSLGMKQRLGVASALMGDPELVVLDEPSNGLDPAGVQDMRALVAALADEGRTVLLSSHLLAEVQQTCHRVGVIGGGRLLSESTVAELRGEARLVVRTDPFAGGYDVATALVGADAVRVEGPELSLTADDRLAPELARRLVAAGIDVHRLETVERSLEDVFLELTGSTVHHAEEAA